MTLSVVRNTNFWSAVALIAQVFTTVLPVQAQTPSTGSGQTYPAKPIRVVIPYPPGGGTDVILRPLAQLMSASMGQQVVVENRGGAGGNIGVQFGPDGAVVVDTGSQENAAKVIAEVRKLTNKPIRYIINTSAEADHVGGNKDVAAAGESVFAASPGQRPDGGVNQASAGASILAHENVLARLSAPTGKVSPFGAEWWATESFAEKRKYFYMNHEGIEVLHQPAAHSDGDSIVFFRISDVVMAGDVLDTTRFPVVDTAKGGSIEGEIAALNKLIELAIPPIPFVFQEGGKIGRAHV